MAPWSKKKKKGPTEEELAAMRVRVNRRRKRSCSAKCWDCASKCCSASLLTAFNVVDSLCGLGIGGYGVYMGMNSFCPVWISISIAGVGFLLLCVALASWRGMSSAGDSGRASVCLSFGSWLAMIAALMEIALGAALVGLKSNVRAWLVSHKADLRLTDSRVDQLLDNTQIIGYVMFGLASFEVVRFFASRHLRGHIEKQSMYERLSVVVEDEDEKSRSERHAVQVSEKYSALREKYAKRWAAPEQEGSPGQKKTLNG